MPQSHQLISREAPNFFDQLLYTKVYRLYYYIYIYIYIVQYIYCTKACTCRSHSFGPKEWMEEVERGNGRQGRMILTLAFSSVVQSCLTLCEPMNCSTPGLPVHHQLPEFTQTHAHQVGDAIQPSHPQSRK